MSQSTRHPSYEEANPPHKAAALIRSEDLPFLSEDTAGKAAQEPLGAFWTIPTMLWSARGTPDLPLEPERHHQNGAYGIHNTQMGPKGFKM